MIELLPKQELCIDALSKYSPIRTVLYGGSAGPGKSFLGCYWQIHRRLKYRATRSMIGRSELKNLKDTTLVTFFEVAELMGLKSGNHYTFNGQSNKIIFENESEILLKDLFSYPSDPNFDSLGSFEIMDGFIDEASQISKKAYGFVRGRMRHKLTHFCNHCSAEGLNKGIVTKIDEKQKPIEWQCPSCKIPNSGLLPKLLMTCNPTSGWLKNDIYKPWKKDKLRPHIAFIPALADDNPHLPPSYFEQFSDMSESDRKRLQDGDWDFDQSPDRIFEYDSLLQMFNDTVGEGSNYITCDPAAMGNDRTVIGIWKGLNLIKIHEFRHKYPHEVATILRQLAKDNNVQLSNVVVDSDGLGIGVKGLLNCREFLNGSSAIDKEHYANLKSECYFKLGDYVRMNKIHCNDYSQRDTIIKELDIIRDTSGEDKKKTVTRKEDIKSKHGFSPDYADMIMMRMFFELKPNYGKYSYA